jgi:hypothetical protein
LKYSSVSVVCHLHHGPSRKSATTKFLVVVERWVVERTEGIIYSLSEWLILAPSLALLSLFHRTVQVLWSGQNERAVGEGYP